MGKPRVRRFLGATFDPVGLYRLNAVLDWLDGLGLSVRDIHAQVDALQRSFVERLTALGLAALHPGQLLEPNAIADHRGDRLRFGFGLYHDEEDVARLIGVLGQVLS